VSQQRLGGLDSRRVVDQRFEGLTAFDDVLQFHPRAAAVVEPPHSAQPLTEFQARKSIEAAVELSNQVFADGARDDSAAAQVE